MNENNNYQNNRKNNYPQKKWNNSKNKNHTNKNLNTEKDKKQFIDDSEISDETDDEIVNIDNQQDRDENACFRSELKEENKPSLTNKKIIREKEDEKEDFNKPKDNNDDEIKIPLTLHSSVKKKLTPDFYRGCCLNLENYTIGCSVLRHGQCKLDNFNWLKDYQDVPHEGELLVAEVRFKNDSKEFYKYPAELELIEGELIVVETVTGHDIGIVSMVGPLVEKQRKRKKNATSMAELKKIYRRARINDVEKFLEAAKQEEHTLYRSREIALDLNLEMKLNDIEYQGDKTKAIFYYTADGRVDFRELIKKLAEEFHVRVEMRQIGVRQESAKLGGIGSCGRELCCSSWIANFQSVTTGVARVQQLSPNPQKLAGQCGKLKCCLNYEYETYVEALKDFPDNHINLKTKKGEAFFQKSDIFKGLMWYSYTFDKSNMMAIPIEKVKEIIEDNEKNILPEQLEDYAFIREQQNTEYGEEGQNVDLSKLE